MNPTQLALFKQYYDSTLASNPDQVKLLRDNYGGDFSKYADAWLVQQSNNLSALDQDPNLVNVLGQLADSGSTQASSILTSAGYQNVQDTSPLPLEQGLLQTVLPGLTQDMGNDAQRQSIAGALASNAIAGTNAANQIAGQSLGGGFDGNTYLANNPDVQQAFASSNDGPVSGTKSINTGQGIVDMTPQQFAEWHYQQFGQREGRQPAYILSQQLAQDFNNANVTTAANIAAANQATQSQLASLSQATAAMQQNLTGNLAVKAQALQQQVAILNQNLDQLDATQKAALAQQIATQQQDLEQSITTQRQGLETQLAALRGAADAQSQAKSAALQTEIAGLTAAQAPLNAARVAAADLQATAVNVGLQRTQDQLTANNAQAGFVGGSTGQDTALARATIDARQRAAEAMGTATTANATDTRDIGVRGATGQRTIAEALADAQNAIAQQGAAGNAGLTSSLATQRQALGDTGAVGLSNITGNTATSRAGIGAYGANTGYTNATTGADQSRTIADALAQGQYGLDATNANNVLAANQAGNAAKATYYDNNYARSLNAALLPTMTASNLASALTGLDAYGRSGTNNALNTLNWWNTSQAAAPTTGAIATQPSTMGNSISNLGASLVGAGINTGIANSWWQGVKPATTTQTTYADFLKNNPTSPAVTGSLAGG